MSCFLLQVVNTSTEQTKDFDINNSFNFFWLLLILSIVEFLIIIYLILKIRKKNSNFDFNDIPKEKLRKAKSSSVDMDNLLNSINGAKDLYKELSRKCHPDRFINTDKQSLAEEIFQEISKNKRNFKALQNIKNRAEQDLEIN